MASRSSTAIITALILTTFVPFVCCQDWVYASSGARPPPYIFSGDVVDKYGHTLYACKIWYSGMYEPGKTWASNGRLVPCKIPWGQKEVEFSNFYVLTKPPEANYYMDWSGSRCVWDGPPSNGVKTSRGEYVGRNGTPNDRNLGKVEYHHQAFFYRIDGVEHWRKCGFQVLLKHKRKIDHYEVYNVKYDFSKESITFAPGKINFNSKLVKNKSPYSIESLAEWSQSVTKTSHWSQTEGIEIYANIETSFKAGIPEVGELGVTVRLGQSVTVTDTHGTSHEMSETISHSEKVKLPPNSAARVYLSARKANIRIPYTSSVKVVFADGASVYRHGVKGIYKGTDVVHFEVSITDAPLKK